MSHEMQAHAGGMLLRLAEVDNVLVASGSVGPGRTVINGGGELVLAKGVTQGHKVAAQAIGAGEPIIKHGVPIGVAMTHIQAGDHVHVHNIRSNYTPTYVLKETSTGGQDV